MDESKEECRMYSAILPGVPQVLYSGLKQSAKQDLFTDLSLIMHDGKVLKAHKIILASISGYFENVLQKIPPQQSSVVCLGREFDGIDNVLKLIYEEGVTFSSEADQEDFRKLCELLKIRDYATMMFSRQCKIEPKSYDQNVSKRKRGPQRRIVNDENGSVLKQLLTAPSPSCSVNSSYSNDDRALNLSISSPSESPSPMLDQEDEDGRVRPYIQIRSEESLREVEGGDGDEGRDVMPNCLKHVPYEPRQNGVTKNPSGNEKSCLQEKSEVKDSQHLATVGSKETMELQLRDNNKR